MGITVPTIPQGYHARRLPETGPDPAKPAYKLRRFAGGVSVNPCHLKIDRPARAALGAWSWWTT